VTHPSCGLICYLLLGFSFLSPFCLFFLAFLASFLALSFLPLSPIAFSSAFPGFLALVNFSSSMVWDVFGRASIYLSSRLTPTSLHSKSSIFSHFAARLGIIFAHQREFLRVKAKSLKIFLRHQVVGFPQVGL
jgi:hypothetical protein